MKLAKMIEPDRVHRKVYADQQIFDREMERIFEKIWVYCGHESQVPKPGDFYTLQIGRQPMVMVRGKNRSINVLYNRCPHRGVQLCGAQKGNTGTALVCSYHAWSFHLDGKLRSVPLPNGYDGTRMSPEDPAFSVKPAARVDSYRGFVFASLSAEGPGLLEFLGEAKIAFDDMCDRSPVGEVEVVPICHRVHPAFELEVLHGESARFIASLGNPPINRGVGGASRKTTQGEDRAGAAVLPLPVNLCFKF